MKDYSIKELTNIFWKSVMLVIICALVGGAGMGMIAKHKQTTTYTARQKVVISHNLNDNRDNRNDQDNMTNADMNMMETYADIAENQVISDHAHQTLSKKLRKTYSAEQVNDAINAVAHPQSLVLSIDAKTSSAKDSVAIANATAKSFKEELPKLQPGAGQVTLLAKPTVKSVNSETKPGLKKYLVAGVALGGFVGIAISFVVVSLKDILKKHK